jgi:FAD/FMN-containing dehydrogenase
MYPNRSLDILRRVVSGEVVLPDDAGYDDARRVWNAMIDRRPSVIVRCRTAADVAAAVAFGREQRLPVAVRGGGHSVAGLGTCEDGVVIDLSGLKRISVDVAARTARVGGGALWGEVDRATQDHGLHVPGGRVTTTGVGGFTTGGGYGWTSSKHGLACDNLIAAEVVLADGRVVTASPNEHADLFWGIRGGGGNFGVVTEFTFRLHPLGPTVLAGLMMWPLERGHGVVRAWRDHLDAAPNELSSAVVVVSAPPEPFVPAELHGRPVVGMAVLNVGEPEAAGPSVQPLRDLAPAVDHVGPMPYTAFQAALDPLAPAGLRSYWRGEYLPALSDDAIDTFLAHAPGLVADAAPFSQAVIFRVGQGVTAVNDDAAAFSHRDAAYLFHPISAWTRAEDDARLIASNRSFSDAMRAFGTGAAYLNFTPEADRVRDGYGDAKYRRLQAVKDTYDPENLFRLNPNVAPTRITPDHGYAGRDAQIAESA